MPHGRLRRPAGSMTGPREGQARPARAAAGAAEAYRVGMEAGARAGRPRRPRVTGPPRWPTGSSRMPVGALELYTVYLGDRLGLYRRSPPRAPTSAELAGRTATAERYVTGMAEHHAASGLLEVDDPAGRTAGRGASGSHPSTCQVLVDTDDVLPLARMGVGLGGAGRPPPQLAEGFRRGAARPPREPEGRAASTARSSSGRSARSGCPIPEIDRGSGRAAGRVADIGWGTGWSSIAMAAHPRVTVDGFDLDPGVVWTAATQRRRGRGGRPGPVPEPDAADPVRRGRYDLVTAFECLHDMARPVGALGRRARMLSGAGVMSWSSTNWSPRVHRAGLGARPLLLWAGAWCRACPRSWAILPPRRPER